MNPLLTPSQALPSAEKVQRTYRLIHQLCEIGNDTRAWRKRMLVELEQWFDAQISVSYVMRFSLDPEDFAPRTLVYIERGTNEIWHRYLAAGDLSNDPVTPHIMQRFGTDFTVARNELVEDAAWYATPFSKNVAIPSGIDDTLYSQIGINDPRVVDGISLCRNFGQPRFTRDDMNFLRFIHQELGRLWNREDPIGVLTLPDRQREVLDGIRRGETRKQIAQKMDVSEHTIHTYEKSLFERAGVSSRGALLARLSDMIRPNLLP